jgi:hypothetical protein
VSRPQKLAFALLLFLYLLPIWLYPLFPSQDGPSHLYNTVIFSEVLTNPQGFFAQFYELNLRPFPNWTFTVLASLLWPLLPLLVVEKIILSAYLVGFVCAAFYLFRSINTEKTVLGFGAFLLGYNWFLLMGFYNFSLSLPLALFTIGYYLRHRRVIRGRRIAVVILLFVALYFSHIVSCAVTGMVLLLFCGLFGQARLRALLEVAIGGSAAGMLFALNLSLRAGTEAKDPLFRLPIADLLQFVASLRIGPWFERWEWVWIALLWVVLGVWIAGSFSQTIRHTSEERPWWLAAAVMLCLALALPNTALGGTALNERLALFVGLFLLPTLSLRGWKWPRSWLVVAFGVLVALQLAYIHYSFREWNRRLEPFQRVAADIPARTKVLPLIFEHNVAGKLANPFLHADGYALAATFGVTPTNYEGYKDYFPVRYRRDVNLAGPGDWWQPSAFLERDMARHYDAVLVWGADAATLSHPALRGFRKTSERAGGKLLLLKRQ